MTAVGRRMSKRRSLKKGFTLIELLIVVVVIATLMGLVFRLAGVGSGQAARNNTITRMQKLEFALSGYFSAFGSYPPVPLHGSRDIFCSINKHGIQTSTGGSRESGLSWPQVRAACLSQPVACEFPYNSEGEGVVESMKRLAATYKEMGGDWAQFGDFDVLENNVTRIPSSQAKSKEWTDVQAFKFGLMSFLLPRYLFMVAGPIELYDGGNGGYQKNGTLNTQWRSQNSLEKIFRFKDGKRLYTDSQGWKKLQEDTSQRTRETQATDYDRTEFRAILMQPSQSVCARWIQALDGIVSGGRTFYGVNTLLDHNEAHGYHYHEGGGELGGSPQMMSGIYAPGKASQDSFNNQYILDGMTVRDGWGMDLFYYSPPPYQSYRLWSAGPNHKTIPPWVDLSSGDMKQYRNTAAEWMADDIVGLSAASN